MKVSVVIPFFNHLRESQEMWESLKATIPADLDHEFILVDDASSDGTREWLWSLRGGHNHVILLERNAGYAHAINTGVRNASGDVLIFGNSDLVFKPGWLPPMLKILFADDLAAGVVGGVQFRVEDGSLDHAGMTLDLTGKWVHLHQLTQPILPFLEVPAVTGACIAVRRTDFDRVGGLDESYRNGGEDVDFCFRVAREGLLSYVALESHTAHHVGLSRGILPSRTAEENSRLLYARWRNQIRDYLAERWRCELAEKTGETLLVDCLDGEFRCDAIDLATSLAEHRLRIEEQRWVKMLEGSTDDQTRIGKSTGLDIDVVLTSVDSNVRLDMNWSGAALPQELVVDLQLVTEILDAEIVANHCHRKIFGWHKAGPASFSLREPYWLEAAPNHVSFTLRLPTEAVRDWNQRKIALRILSDGIGQRIQWRSGA